MDFTSVAVLEAGYRAALLDKTISPKDHMYNTGPDWYFVVGEDAIRCVLRALGASFISKVNRILDLPSGHGRVARHLRACFPSAEITFADIDTDGADFCAQQFRGRSVHSQPDLAAVDLGGGYDVIWIGSLFTHVDQARAEAWTRHLCGCLSPHGVLIATVHGAWSRQVHRRYGALIGEPEWAAIEAGCAVTGWGYASYGGPEDYGVSLCTASAVLAMAGRIPGVRVIGYGERAWAGNHDVLTLSAYDRMEAW